MSIPFVCYRCLQRSWKIVDKQVRHYTAQGTLPNGHTSRQVRSSAAGDKWLQAKPEIAEEEEKTREKGSDPILKSVFAVKQKTPGLPKQRRYSREPLSPPKKKRDRSTIATGLFQDVVNSRTLPPGLETQAGVDRFSELSRTRRLQPMLDLLRGELAKSDPLLPRIWHYTVILLNALKYRKESNPIDEFQLFGYLHEVLTQIAWSGEVNLRTTGGKRQRISAANIIAFYLSRKLRDSWWHDILWIQLGELIRVKHTDEGKALHYRLDLVLQTLDKYPRPRGPAIVQLSESRQSPSEGATESAMEEGSDFVKSLHHNATKHQNLSARFNILFGDNKDMVEDKRMRMTASAAALIHHYLKVASRDGQRDFSANKDLKDRLQTLANDVNFDCEDFVSCLRAVSVSRKLIDAEKVEWLQSPVECVKNLASLSNGTRHTTSVRGTMLQLDEIYKEAHRFREFEDVRGAKNTWAILKDRLSAENSQKQAFTQEEISSVFARFLKLFNELRRMDLTTDVWNFMISYGTKPETKHWTAMIAGCSHVRDITSMHGIWHQLLNANVQPDNETWTTYIHGVVKSGDYRHGLTLLETLSKHWKSHSDVLQPDLGPVHGALSGFADSKGRWGREAIHQMQQTIFRWARMHGLKPTTYTYNILLEPLARCATFNEINDHLTSMNDDSCTPDIITWTLVLRGLVSTHSPFFSLSMEEQTSALKDILETMDATSLYPSPQTYTTLLYALLDAKIRSPNLPAAKLVLAHMDAANIEASDHIHTILLTHYFRSTPPDLPAVDALLAKVHPDIGSRSKRMRPFFWNRLITCYADVDEWEKALRWLRRKPNGEQGSWVAMWKVLLALERAKEWDIAAELVADAEKHGGKLDMEDDRMTEMEASSNRSILRGERMGEHGGYKLWGQKVRRLRAEGLIPGGGQGHELGSGARQGFGQGTMGRRGLFGRDTEERAGWEG